jgi:hypothetical protein
VVQSAEHLSVGREIQTGEVEERQGVAVADVEEEVRRALIVPVLEDLGQWEAQQVLVEADGRLDIGGQQRQVVNTAGGGGRAVFGGPQVAGADGIPLGGAVDVFAVATHS